jgi:uncharacterized repeat protein (TIGR04042 family)
MPEMHFTVLWPDGRQERCYSPSLVIRELMSDGAEYPVYEFMERSRAGLRIAAERVRVKYGFYCSAALDQLAQLEARAEGFPPEATVRIVTLSG